MRFRLTGDQRALRDGVRGLLERRFGREELWAAVASGRLDRGLWRELGAAGFFALRLPEADGGVGLGLPETVLAFEEAGRALLPGPLIATHLAAGSVPGAASGETVVTAADGPFVEWLADADVVVGGDAGGGGEARGAGAVVGGDGGSGSGVRGADVVVGGDGGSGSGVRGADAAVGGDVGAGAGVRGAVSVRSVDPLTPLHRLVGEGEGAGEGEGEASRAGARCGGTGGRPAGDGGAGERRVGERRVGDPEAGAPRGGDPAAGAPRAGASRAGDPGGEVRGRSAPDPVAVLLTAAEQLGSAGRTCEMAVEHARVREQFGRPVGAFQAVQHLCADLLVRVEVARAAVYAAAVTADPVDIAAARLLADEAAVRGARDCLQVHGGMGFTWESEVHLHLKRAWVRERRAGGGAMGAELLAADLVAPGA
ncbi:acyl-CoA dehydrogenase family protein [Streptomyces sp. NPDC048290]|uniref:acyl-CoA dehydrogenase family protein n=1 Tax=Streptomyces sp. NPDC048290 TaxID=3155811 RepID=UPI003425A3AC